MEFIKPTMGTINFADEEVMILEKAYDIVYDFYDKLGLFADVYDDDGKLFLTNTDVMNFRNALEEFGALAEQGALRYQINR